MKLIDILKLIDHDGVPITDSTDVRDATKGSAKVSIRFMSEEETWTTLYPGHPLLLPFYDCEVESIDSESGITVIWLEYENYLKKFIN